MRSARAMAWTLAAVAVAGGAWSGAPAAAGAAFPVVTRVAGPDRIATAVEVSRATFADADAAVLARADVPADALAGAPFAAWLGAPLLLVARDDVPDTVMAELGRLGVSDIYLLGGTAALDGTVERALEDYHVERVAGADRLQTALAIARRLPPSPHAYVANAAGFADALAAGPVAAADGAPILLAGADPGPLVQFMDAAGTTDVTVVGGTAAVSDGFASELAGPDRQVARLGGTDRFETAAALADRAVELGADPATVWLATGDDFPDTLAAGPAVAAAGGVLLVLDGAAPWTTRPATERLRTWQPSAVVVVGGTAAVSSNLTWQLPIVLTGPTLPRGGAAPYPAYRLVAFYGHHRAATLGVLGEQPPDEAYDRLMMQAGPYGSDGREVLPTFDLIASLATSGPGPDGDYSAPSSAEEIQPWLDAARRHGVLLVLDLQSGRTDFLTEARRYEAFLRQPDVGLALDPEWRMEPDQVPGKVVGHVTADEVNAVSRWLAGLVRSEGLPQKPFIIHQFQLQMIRDRERLETPPELATIIQMDGQGSRAAKLNTYATITRDAGAWANGFKLFYDEDPDLFAPADVLGLTPRPDYVSYQ